MKDVMVIEGVKDETVLIRHGEKATKDFSHLQNLRMLRASSIGRKCDTELFLSASGLESQFDKKTLRIFEIGHIMEPVVVKWMREDGWEVKHNDDDSLGMIMAAGSGIITGHPDIFARHPKITKNEWILADIKTMNSRRYSAWTKNGVKESDPSYLAQLLFYGHAWGYDKLGLVAIDKSSGDYSVELFDFDSKMFNKLYERAKEILDADMATPMKYSRECNWCSKKDSCKGTMTNDLPRIKDTKHIIDILAHMYELYEFADDGNLKLVKPKMSLEEILLPPDGKKIVFDGIDTEITDEEEEIGDWIEIS